MTVTTHASLWLFLLLGTTLPLSTVAATTTPATVPANVVQNKVVVDSPNVKSLIFNNGQLTTCAIEVENWTRWPFVFPSVRMVSGKLALAPGIILPAGKVSMLVHKPIFAVEGTRGTVSWEVLRQTNRQRLHAMWTVPSSLAPAGNALAVGLSANGDVSSPPRDRIYRQMYTGVSDSQLGFSRGHFDEDVDPIKYEADGLIIDGIMGTGNKVDVRIVARPTAKADLAPSIPNEIQTSTYQHPIDQLY